MLIMYLQVCEEVSTYSELTDFWCRSNQLTQLDATLQVLKPLTKLQNLYLQMNPCCGAFYFRTYLYSRL